LRVTIKDTYLYGSRGDALQVRWSRKQAAANLTENAIIGACGSRRTLLGALRSLLTIDTQGAVSEHAGIRDAIAAADVEIVGRNCVSAEMTAHIEAADTKTGR